MQINIEKLCELERNKGWSEYTAARVLGIDYSYYYRIKRGIRGVGPKFLEGLINLCDRDGKEFKDFLILNSKDTKQVT